MKDIYTPASMAADVLMERKQNQPLKERVGEYLGNIVPASCLGASEPIAFLARYVPRATNEDKLFAEAAQTDGFTPFWASYVSDRFTTRNPEKVATVRPIIQWGKNQRTKTWVVAPENRVGGVGELKTVFGATSTDYQREIRATVFRNDDQPTIADQTFDMGEWYKLQANRFGYQTGRLAPYYYQALMALTIANGVLYEDFDGGPNAGSGDLKAFREEIVYPAFDEAERAIGERPLIVQLPFRDNMEVTDMSFLDDEKAAQLKQFGRVEE